MAATVHAEAHGHDDGHSRSVRVATLSSTSNTASQISGTIISQIAAEDESRGIPRQALRRNDRIEC